MARIEMLRPSLTALHPDTSQVRCCSAARCAGRSSPCTHTRELVAAGRPGPMQLPPSLPCSWLIILALHTSGAGQLQAHVSCADLGCRQVGQHPVAGRRQQQALQLGLPCSGLPAWPLGSRLGISI